MTAITFLGKPIKTVGRLPKLSELAPAFTLTKTDLSEISLMDLKGKKAVLSIFPSLDTPTCAIAMRKFNEAAQKLPEVTVLCISADLPFAHQRFCAAENLSSVVTVSTFRHPEFGKRYGVTIAEGPLAGLLSRAVLVLDKKGKIIHAQQVAELSHEPNYETVLAVL
jgi:thiol peroxidase